MSDRLRTPSDEAGTSLVIWFRFRDTSTGWRAMAHGLTGEG